MYSKLEVRAEGDVRLLIHIIIIARIVWSSLCDRIFLKQNDSGDGFYTFFSLMSSTCV